LLLLLGITLLPHSIDEGTLMTKQSWLLLSMKDRMDPDDPTIVLQRRRSQDHDYNMPVNKNVVK